MRLKVSRRGIGKTRSRGGLCPSLKAYLPRMARMAGSEYSNADIMMMQQDAVRRVMEMDRRARRTLDQTGGQQPDPGFAAQKDIPSPQDNNEEQDAMNDNRYREQREVNSGRGSGYRGFQNPRMTYTGSGNGAPRNGGHTNAGERMEYSRGRGAPNGYSNKEERIEYSRGRGAPNGYPNREERIEYSRGRGAPSGYPNKEERIEYSRGRGMFGGFSNQRRYRRPEKEEPEQKPKSGFGLKSSTFEGILDKIGIDTEVLLLLILVFILMNEGADISLLLALGYIIL